MRGPGTKTARNAHAKRRGLQRYGLELNRLDLKAMNQQIQTGAAEFIRRQSLSRTIWKVKFQEKELFVVYHGKTHGIVTFLRPEWLT